MLISFNFCILRKAISNGNHTQGYILMIVVANSKPHCSLWPWEDDLGILFLSLLSWVFFWWLSNAYNHGPIYFSTVYVSLWAKEEAKKRRTMTEGNEGFVTASYLESWDNWQDSLLFSPPYYLHPNLSFCMCVYTHCLLRNSHTLHRLMRPWASAHFFFQLVSLTFTSASVFVTTKSSFFWQLQRGLKRIC